MKRLTDDECDTFRRLPLSFNDMIRAAYDAGWQWQIREPINKELVEALEDLMWWTMRQADKSDSFKVSYKKAQAALAKAKENV